MKWNAYVHIFVKIKYRNIENFGLCAKCVEDETINGAVEICGPVEWWLSWAVQIIMKKYLYKRAPYSDIKRY